MRHLIAAAALLALSACASAPPPAASAGGWTYAYDAAHGQAIATQTEPNGSVSATFSCQPPTGDLVVADYSLARGAGDAQATIRVDTFSITVPARYGSGATGQPALLVPLPQRPPVLAAARAGVPMTIAVGGRSHELAEGAAQKLQEVAYACWTSGS